MKTRVQLLLDRNIVKPLVVFLNLFVKLAGKIFRIDHSLDKEFKVIAVCKFKGMGSIIQATPLLQTLRKNFPEAKIIFVTTDANRQVLKRITCVDEIITLNDSSVLMLLFSFPAFITKLIRRKIELYFDLEIYSNFSSLVTTMSLARNRIGYYYSASMYRSGMYTHMAYFNTRIPVSRVYLQLAKMISCKDLVTDLVPLSFHEKENPFLHSLLTLRSFKYIVINPNASDLRIERRWPLEKFVLLINELIHFYPDLHIYLIGNKKEESYVKELLGKCMPTGKVASLAGNTSIEELIALIQYADLVITNDTGPMHIAFATGTKTISLFGPCSPDQHPGGAGNYAIYKKAECSPCVHDFLIPPCRGNNVCMKMIEVNEVFEAVSRMLQPSFKMVQSEIMKETISYFEN
jgi:ADP-heptose:LPS heptosyltransferase